jgi:hypothetical protein
MRRESVRRQWPRFGATCGRRRKHGGLQHAAGRAARTRLRGGAGVTACVFFAARALGIAAHAVAAVRAPSGSGTGRTPAWRSGPAACCAHVGRRVKVELNLAVRQLPNGR